MKFILFSFGFFELVIIYYLLLKRELNDLLFKLITSSLLIFDLNEKKFLQHHLLLRIVSRQPSCVQSLEQ